MKLLHADSLALTVNAVNDMFLFNEKVNVSEKKKVADFIAERQGIPYSYAGTFAPTEKDMAEGALLYTGERMKSRASTMHILGEESIRVLLKLDVKNKKVTDALKLAENNMLNRLTEGNASGYYCCGNCSVSVWRNINAGGFNKQEERLVNGLKELKKSRDGKGRWGRFHYYYTLSALVEMELKQAIQELKYSASTIERSLKRQNEDDIFGRRRKLILETALNKI